MTLRLLSRISSSNVHHYYQQSLHSNNISRAYWQEVIRVRRDKKTGKFKHEDPERVVKRFQEQRRSDGESLLDLHNYNDKHEKPWMKKKRLAEKRRYEFDKKHVMDLAKYIQFVQDNKEK